MGELKKHHLRWMLGSVAPVAGYLAATVFANHADGSQREAWWLPIGTGLGSVLLLWRRREEPTSLPLTIYGLIAGVVALFYASIYTIFDGWMHGF